MKRAVEHAEEHEFDRLEDFEMNTDNPGFEDGILGVFVYKLFKGPSHANGNAIVVGIKSGNTKSLYVDS